jgi:hypothetical protein
MFVAYSVFFAAWAYFIVAERFYDLLRVIWRFVVTSCCKWDFYVAIIGGPTFTLLANRTVRMMGDYIG